MPELVFPVPDSGSGGVADLVGALSEEARRQDAASLVVSGSFPQLRPDRVCVAVQDPDGEEVQPPPAWLSRTILVLLEPPGSVVFERGVELAPRVGAVFHVNSAATSRLLEARVPPRHLQLGYSPAWGGFNAGGAAELEIVRDRGGYFDWTRSLRAIHRGAVVLHEHSLGMAPLVAGRQLFVGAPAALDEIAAALRRDPERLERVRLEAIGFVREALPLALAAAALIGAARALVAQPLASADPTPGQLTLRSK